MEVHFKVRREGEILVGGGGWRTGTFGTDGSAGVGGETPSGLRDCGIIQGRS